MYINNPTNIPQIQNLRQYGQYGEANYQSFLNKKEEGEEYDPMMRYLGGKRRSKGGKTRKHKKKKTRKLKRGKRKQTKYKRRKQTKKH